MSRSMVRSATALLVVSSRIIDSDPVMATSTHHLRLASVIRNGEGRIARTLLGVRWRGPGADRKRLVSGSPDAPCMQSLPIALVRSPRWVGIPLRLLPHQYTGSVGEITPQPTGLVVVVVLAVVVVLLAGAAPARATESVLVNVNADGDTPIGGAVVSASGCARGGDGRADAVGSPLRQSTGQLAEPTNAAGVALLQFDRLPRCLIVDAAGGQANGGTLHDSFRAEAHNETGDLMNVFVTPVSTLTHDAMRERPDLSEREAPRVVERLLGIPSHFDDFDLAADDGPFDGDTYLAAASRAGGVDRLNAALLRTDRRRAFHGRHAVAADTDADLQKWWNDLDVTKM